MLILLLLCRCVYIYIYIYVTIIEIICVYVYISLSLYIYIYIYIYYLSRALELCARAGIARQGAASTTRYTFYEKSLRPVAQCHLLVQL